MEGINVANIFFSIILYVDHDENLKNSIRAITNVSKDTLESLRIIVVDPICSDISKSLCAHYGEKYGTKNFIYIEAPGASIGEAYNMAIPEIRGKYVNFSMSSMELQRGAVECVYECAMELENPKLISLAPWTVNEKGESVPYQLSPTSKVTDYERINLIQEPARLQLLLQAFFIRSYIVSDQNHTRFFNPELMDEASIEFLLRIFAEYQYYIFMPRITLNYTVQLEDNTSAFNGQHYKWWYMDAFRNWILPFENDLCKKYWPLNKSIQIALLYVIATRFLCNYNDRNKGVLSYEEYLELGQLTGQALNCIDNELIWKKSPGQTFTIPRTLRVLLLNYKARYMNCKNEIVHYQNQLNMWMHEDRSTKAVDAESETLEVSEVGYSKKMFSVSRSEGELPYIADVSEDLTFFKLTDIQKEHVLFKAVNFQNGQLEIDGTFSMGDFFEHDQIDLCLIRNGKISKIEYSEIYGLNKVFGFIYNHMYQFHVNIPVYSFKNKIDIQFAVIMNGVTYIMEIRTPKAHAHVRVGIKNQYWRFCKDWCATIPDKTHLVLSLLSEGGMKKKETEFRKELSARAAKGSRAAALALEIRKQYFEQKQDHPDARIWITHDKLYKAGDNGEYMYNYIMQQNDGIDIYYIIKEDSLDFERMNVEGANLLIWGEMDTMVKVLLSEVVLATHTDVLSYAGFDKDVIPFICDLYNPVTVCIQHGLTTQNIAQYQNRVFDNLHLYTLASPNEFENLSRPIYGFEDKSILKMTGLARYDGLKNNDQKQILITPTWRRNIANASVAHIKKGHNDFFKNSEYFRIYNGLINDQKLIDCAKESGYKLIYLLHPAASSQADDFDKNDYVEIIPAASDMNYEKILTESSLMVTDYSGVQFDFAYMRKPLLYYHPKTLPPHYDESEAYVYERDSFGPIIDNHEELVDQLCEYMKNGCKTKPEYVERADKFFAYSDFNSCKRIYEEVLLFLGSK